MDAKMSITRALKRAEQIEDAGVDLLPSMHRDFLALAKEIRRLQDRRCEWHWQPDDTGIVYATTCGFAFTFEVEPGEVHFTYCPGCGCKISNLNAPEPEGGARLEVVE